MELEGQVAAITGAASGIGAATARALAAAGAIIALLDRDHAAADILAADLKADAAPAASYITGQMIFVDGGYTLPSLTG